MSTRKHRRQPKQIVNEKEQYGLWRLGVQHFDVRDPYYFSVSLSWPRFVAAMIACWLAINLVFAALYDLRPGDVDNASPPVPSATPSSSALRHSQLSAMA